MKTSKHDAIALTEKQKRKERTRQVDWDRLARMRESLRESARQGLEKNKIKTIEKQTSSMEALAYFQNEKRKDLFLFLFLLKRIGVSLA